MIRVIKAYLSEQSVDVPVHDHVVIGGQRVGHLLGHLLFVQMPAVLLLGGCAGGRIRCTADRVQNRIAIQHLVRQRLSGG